MEYSIGPIITLIQPYRLHRTNAVGSSDYSGHNLAPIKQTVCSLQQVPSFNEIHMFHHELINSLRSGCRFVDDVVGLKLVIRCFDEQIIFSPHRSHYKSMTKIIFADIRRNRPGSTIAGRLPWYTDVARQHLSRYSS